jgi:cyclic dehypoxanthinyl futalosine synthase
MQQGAPDQRRVQGSEITDLFRTHDLHELAARAMEVRWQKHPHPVTTYVVDRNISITNVCTSGCDFCAFYRPPGHPEGYVHSIDTILKKVAELVAVGGTQVLIQGGLNPDLSLEAYVELFAAVRKRFPEVTIHSLSPVEVVSLARRGQMSPEAVLRELVRAGLDSLPGGGAEILVDRVRDEVHARKCSSSEWLEVMEIAHRLGLPTTATMMFGHVETYQDRADHLLRIRELQDRTGGFTAFIPWTYQPGNTKLGGRAVGGVDYLKTLAISRIVLDNIENIQASWLTQGLKIGQMALFCGANDIGGTILEENVVRATGLRIESNEEEIRRTIKNAGFRPQKRDTQYRWVEEAAQRSRSA